MGRTVDVVALLRGVNVGGHKLLKSAEIVRRLAALGVEATSRGASGNFILRGVASPSTAIARLREVLPHEAEIVVRTAAEWLAAVKAEPFAHCAAGPDVHWYATFLKEAPTRAPRFPVEAPAGRGWRVRLFAMRNRIAYSIYRRIGGKPVDPNGLVERELGVVGTTRNWNTVLALVEMLEA